LSNTVLRRRRLNLGSAAAGDTTLGVEDLTLSHHPARAAARRLAPSVECRVLKRSDASTMESGRGALVPRHAMMLRTADL